MLEILLSAGRTRCQSSAQRGGRALQQSASCITSTTTVNYTTLGLASDPWCLQVGEFSVLCPKNPDQPCACPTLSYVNVIAQRNNLLGCYDPSAYFCSTGSPQWLPTATNYGRTALIQGSGVSNIGTCWNESTQALSTFGTTNKALLPSAAEVATASAEAIAAAAPPAAAPPASPAPDLTSGINNAANSNAGKIAAVVGSIVGPTLAIILWASITFSHREEKQMVLSGVVRHVTVADMTDSNATLITSTSQPSPPLMATPFASPAVKLPFDSASFPQSDISGQVEMTEVSRRDSVPVSDTASSLGRAASVSMLGRSASEQQGVGLLDAARNPEPHNITEQAEYPSKEVKKIAKDITARCLRRWDGFLAVLRAVPGAPEPPGSLMAAWQESTSHERGHLLTLITKTLQDISKEEAQALPIKDPESAGLHDKLSSFLDRCTGRFKLRHDIPSMTHQ
ncbi:hypothetical protein WJX82_003404 [Trebouxia sp. C0006]